VSLLLLNQTHQPIQIVILVQQTVYVDEGGRMILRHIGEEELLNCVTGERQDVVLSKIRHDIGFSLIQDALNLSVSLHPCLNIIFLTVPQTKVLPINS